MDRHKRELIMTISTHYTNSNSIPKAECDLFAHRKKKQDSLSREIIHLEITSEKDFRGTLLPEDLPSTLPFTAKPLVCSIYNSLKTRNLIPFEDLTAIPLLKKIQASYEKQQTIRPLPPFENIFDTVVCLQDLSVLSIRKMTLAEKWTSQDKKLEAMGVEYVYLPDHRF